jgi:hypothetical protein
MLLVYTLKVTLVITLITLDEPTKPLSLANQAAHHFLRLSLDLGISYTVANVPQVFDLLGRVSLSKIKWRDNIPETYWLN